MVAYAVGEMTRQAHATWAENNVTRSGTVGITQNDREDHECEKRLKPTTTHTYKQRLSKPTSCYEVVTAWVHPR